MIEFSRRKSEAAKGFTIIEVLIAIAVLAIVSLALSSSLVVGTRVIGRTRQTTLAAQICQEEVEKIRSMSFDQFLTLGTSFTNANLSRLESGQGARTIESGPGEQIRKLTVSVSWMHQGRPRRTAFSTFVTRQGLVNR